MTNSQNHRTERWIRISGAVAEAACPLFPLQLLLVTRANRRAIERAREPKAQDRAKILEEGAVGDALAPMQQLGANPSAATAGSRDTTPGTDSDTVRRRDVPVAGTLLAIELRGSGPPLMLIHGGGEDAAMLSGQAESLASAGFAVISYDRRGTGRSGREDWPGAGADRHADDAAALLEALAVGPATVVGVSSGGVIALDLAAQHPDAVARVVAWEPPAAGVVPYGDIITAEIMGPVHAHLSDHPGDFVGAQAILLSTILGFPVGVDDPDFAATRRNAEPMILDEPTITLQRFEPEALSGIDVTIALGSAPLDLISDVAMQFERWTGRPSVVVEARHDVYLTDPAVLTRVVSQLLD
jgi:pimeloyl-ACP methyl ester carboxylesterase